MPFLLISGRGALRTNFIYHVFSAVEMQWRGNYFKVGGGAHLTFAGVVHDRENPRVAPNLVLSPV